MQYEQTYRGERIIVLTRQDADGAWTAEAMLPDGGRRISLAGEPGKRHPSEDAARQAAVSVAIEAIDSARISKGKP